jgi:hypothetical protein
MELIDRLSECLVSNKLILTSSEIDLDEAERIGTEVYSSNGTLAGYYIDDGYYNYSAYCNVSRGNFANAFRVASVVAFLNIDKSDEVLFEYMDLVCKTYFDTDSFHIDRNIILKNIKKVKSGLYEVRPIIKKYFWVRPYTNIGGEDKIIEGVLYEGKRKLVMNQYNKSKRIQTLNKIENAVNLLIEEGNKGNTFLTISDIEELSGIPKKTISNVYALFKNDIDKYNTDVFKTSIYAEFVKMSNVFTISSSIVKFKEEMETRLTKRKVAGKSNLHINTVYNLWLEDEVQDSLDEYNNWLREFKNK